MIDEDAIESSREKALAELEAASAFFETHGGDLLMWGEISPVGAAARVSVFRNGGADTTEYEINLAEEWASALTPKIEAQLLRSLAERVHQRIGESTRAWLQRTEPLGPKIQHLADTAQEEDLRTVAADLYSHLESGLEIARNDIRYKNGWRLICPDGCMDTDQAKADFCVLAASIATTGQIPTAGYLRGVAARERREKHAAAHTYWKACLHAEGFRLQECKMNEPDCTIASDPFSFIY